MFGAIRQLRVKSKPGCHLLSRAAPLKLAFAIDKKRPSPRSRFPSSADPRGVLDCFLSNDTDRQI